MNIVLLESLGIPEAELKKYAQELEKEGHTFRAYEKNTDPAVQIERAKDADVIMLANMPLSGEVIRSCPSLRFIDVPLPAWIMWIWKLQRRRKLR